MKSLKFIALLLALCCCSTINAAARQDEALPRFVTLTWKLSLDPSGNITRLELPDDEIGSALYDKMELAPGSEIAIDGMKARAFATTEYGYLVMDRTPNGWQGTLYGVEGDRVLAHCSFKERSIDCRR